MGIISSLMETRNDAMENFLRKPMRSAQQDESLSELKALHSTAVFGCVRIISETVAWLPLPIYRRLANGGKQKATDYDLYNLLQTRPHPEVNAFTFRETMNSHLMLWGNAYAEIEFKNGKPVQLNILPPDKTSPERTEQGNLFYEITLKDGEKRKLADYQVLHIVGLGFDGTKGHSPIQMAKKAVNLSLALDNFGYNFFKNGTNVGAVVTSPDALSDKAYSRLKDDLSEKYEGLGNEHRMMLLEEGMTFSKNTIPPNDAQFLESRKFQITDIARIYRVPPHMLADLERATFSNIEHQDLSFVKHTMMPYFRRWEQAINMRIIPENDQQTYFSEFLVDGLLRGDITARYTAYQTALQNGWFNRNEIRAMENHNPMEGEEGELYTVNSATIPLKQLLQEEPENDNNDIQEDERSFKKKETRAKHEFRIRSARQRTKIAKSFQPVFRDAVARIVKREKADIKRQAEKDTRDAQDLLLFVEQFYDKHGEFVRKNIAPAYASLTQAIKAAALDEVDGEDVDTNKLIDDMVDVFEKKYIARSRKGLQKKIRNAIENNEDVLEVLDTEFENRTENAPRRYAEEETVGASSAVSKFVWVAAGVTMVRWIAQGSEDCPFCADMDGKTVGIEQNFVGKGESVGADGKQMKTSNVKLHPPLHDGCDCTISPE